MFKEASLLNAENTFHDCYAHLSTLRYISQASISVVHPTVSAIVTADVVKERRGRIVLILAEILGP